MTYYQYGDEFGIFMIIYEQQECTFLTKKKAFLRSLQHNHCRLQLGNFIYVIHNLSKINALVFL